MQSRMDVCFDVCKGRNFVNLLGKKNKKHEQECEREAEFTGEGERVEVYQSLFLLLR